MGRSPAIDGSAPARWPQPRGRWGADAARPTSGGFSASVGCGARRGAETALAPSPAASMPATRAGGAASLSLLGRGHCHGNPAAPHAAMRRRPLPPPPLLLAVAAAVQRRIAPAGCLAARLRRAVGAGGGGAAGNAPAPVDRAVWNCPRPRSSGGPPALFHGRPSQGPPARPRYACNSL